MKRLLFISHCLPYPPDKGERIRAYWEIRTLSKDFLVTVASLTRQEDPAAASAQTAVAG